MNSTMIHVENMEPEAQSMPLISVQTPTVDIKARKSDVISEPGNASSVPLGEKLLGDVLVGASVTFAVAPFLTVVDKAIVQSAAGSHTLLKSGFQSITGMLRNPVQYFKSPTFLLMWSVYAATYSTANSLKTLTEHQEYKEACNRNPNQNTRQSAGFGKVGIFLGTATVNSGTSLLKDRAYARMFGTSVQSSIPKMSYVLWMARDLSVVGSSFILPDIVSPKIVETYGMDQKVAQSVCQISLPIATQFVAGPLHFMGLDLYNRNLDGKSWREAIVDRSKALYRGFAAITTARVARIAPGYGIGGVLNTRYRDSWRDHLIQREIQSMMKNSQNPSAQRLVALLHGKTKPTAS